MATKISGGDVNVAFGNNVEANLALFGHSLLMMATTTPPIRDTWIVEVPPYERVPRTTAYKRRRLNAPFRRRDGECLKGILILNKAPFVPSAYADLLCVL